MGTVDPTTDNRKIRRRPVVHNDLEPDERMRNTPGIARDLGLNHHMLWSEIAARVGVSPACRGVSRPAVQHLECAHGSSPLCPAGGLAVLPSRNRRCGR